MKRHVYFFFGAGRSLESGAYSTTIIFLKKKKKKKKDSYKEIITIAFSNWKILYYGYVPM